MVHTADAVLRCPPSAPEAFAAVAAPFAAAAPFAVPPPRVHADSRLPPMLMDERTRRGLKEPRDKGDETASAGPTRPSPPAATAGPLPLTLNPSPPRPRPLLLAGELNRAARPPLPPYPCCPVGLAMVGELTRTSWPPCVVVVEPPAAPPGDFAAAAAAATALSRVLLPLPPLSLLSDPIPLKPIFSRCLLRRAILECSFRPPSC